MALGCTVCRLKMPENEDSGCAELPWSVPEVLGQNEDKAILGTVPN